MSMALRRPSVDGGTGVRFREPSVDAGASRGAIIMTSAFGGRQTPYFRVENTYRLEPNKIFSACQVRNVIKRVFDQELKNVTYEPSKCNLLSSQLSDAIKKGVKDLGYSRYKIVAMVVLGQPKMSAISFTSRCIWNAKVDTFSEYVHNGDDIYAVGLVYGIYCE